VQVLIADDDPVRLMYTAGTEARPKGVMLSSRSLISQYVSCAIDGGMAADDIDLHALPLYHCAQLDCFLSVDIYLGATSVILPAPDPATVLATIEREKVSKLFCPPTVWISLLRYPDFRTRDLSSLRKGYMSYDMGSDVQLWNFYGQNRNGAPGHDPPSARTTQPHRLRRPRIAQCRDSRGRRAQQRVGDQAR
jgi:fatty-acyl-CoA synthase